jgi:hypothetical protein
VERLDREPLDVLWPTLDEDEKSTISRKLNDAFSTIRKIPQPGFYGSVERGSVPHHSFYSYEADLAICGPFDSESEFNAALTRRQKAIWAENGKHSFKADFNVRNPDAMLKEHPPTLSHAGLQRKNRFEVAKID